MTTHSACFFITSAWVPSIPPHEWVVTQSDLMSSIHELKGKRLGCWCAPRSCHGDILSRLANESNLDVFL